MERYFTEILIVSLLVILRPKILICVDTILLTDPITIALLTSVPKIVVRFSTIKKNYSTNKYWIHKLNQDYNVAIKELID
jgi:hypothetical protein